jgi:hypothetical protein
MTRSPLFPLTLNFVVVAATLMLFYLNSLSRKPIFGCGLFILRVVGFGGVGNDQRKVPEDVGIVHRVNLEKYKYLKLT